MGHHDTKYDEGDAINEGATMDNKLRVAEQNALTIPFDTQRILDKMNVWDRAEPTRKAVAAALQEIFPEAFITIGGHHVAVHDELIGVRTLLITGTSPDFS